MNALLDRLFGQKRAAATGGRQDPDPEAIIVAKKMLVKYADLDTTPDKLDAGYVEAWIERFWSEKGLRKLSPEAARALTTGLIKKLTPAQFQAACQKIEADWQPYWRNAPSLQNIIDAGISTSAGQGTSDTGRVRMLQGLLNVCLSRRPGLGAVDPHEVVAL